MKRALALLGFVVCQMVGPDALGEAVYSPPVAVDHPVQVFWGDTHLHTALSGDSFNYTTRRGPEVAYRFAKGEEVVSTTGQPVRLRRPLDFLVISDHANNLGAQFARGNFDNDPSFRRTRLGRLWKKARAELMKDESTDLEHLASGYLAPVHWEGSVSVRHEAFRREVWESVTAAADRHNDPGRFTAFIGYEWTPRQWAVHRVVVFRDNADKANQILPFSSYDSTRVEDLWEFFDRYERDTGGAILSIPHNSNLTSGNMFKPSDSDGNPFDGDYVRTRARWEPLMEATQIKGDSETHPLLSPGDPFADFETWNGWGGVEPNPQKPMASIRFEYARSALQLGLDQQQEHGINPFKFGMIGSTDSHTALATADEDNSFGKFARDEPAPERMFSDWPGWEAGASGYAAVWATANTREAIYDAMKRRETYATSGPRILLRFFGGWEFSLGDATRADFATIGYRKGVPMGGDLTRGPSGAAPTFMVHAVKDAANLDRIQIIKGWRTESGLLNERVYDVAWSDGRSPRANGDLPPVGSTVDVADASYGNSIGAPELVAVWRDPHFDPGQYAFYYVRVIEIPTPRWTAYDAKYYGLKNLDPEIPLVLQERAYSSPIWYTPGN